jgi:hypothetical protein
MTAADPVSVNFSVPDMQRQAFVELTRASVEVIAALALDLESLEVATITTGRLALRDLIAKHGFDDPNDVAEALFEFGVFRASTGIPADQAAAGIAADLEGAAGQSDISAVLAAKGLVKLAKIADLTNATYRKMYSARIVTDLRAVFHEEVGDGASAALVLHQLEIESIKNGDTEEFFVTLSDEDLDVLSRQIARAREKSSWLRDLAAGAQIEIVE